MMFIIILQLMMIMITCDYDHEWRLRDFNQETT